MRTHHQYKPNSQIQHTVNMWPFNLCKDDWYPIWAHVEEWTNYELDEKGKNKVFEHASYTIYYSPSRKKYDLRFGGHNPKFTEAYPESIKKLNDFIHGTSESKL